MSSVDDPKPEQDADEWSVEQIDHDRRALIRFTKYTAPAMLATLLSTKQSFGNNGGGCGCSCSGGCGGS
jgi:hypothetical protein